ncbi:MAG: GNAT family N-acetyltransferase [Planctomycetales bacterium]|nr:GNAT family N-acetyltransferase [Planctomycetales bacterium]
MGVEVRTAAVEDVAALVELNKVCFPVMAEENVVWSKRQLTNHIRLFPQGQLVATLDGRIVGACSSLIVHLGDDPYRPHTYAGITDGGYFHNHDPQGDTLYGADVYVHPDCRGEGVGHALYEARRELCQRLKLRRILAGGRLHGYDDYAQKMDVNEYVRAVEDRQIRDLVLSFQLREGFVVRGVLNNYIVDPLSRNHATLIEWLNPDYEGPKHGPRKVRFACVQYQVRGIETFEDFANQVDYFVETAFDYRADFVVFPEFFSVQLLSQKKLRRLPALEGIRRLAELEDEFLGLMRKMATDYGIHIIAGSHPVERNGKLFNVCPVIGTDGGMSLQPKLHITPAEKRYWGISGGDRLDVIATPKAKIGIQICYDIEFPEPSRYLADQGAEIIVVPYCTDDRQGYVRVRTCAQARAIENQVYVVTSGIIGNLPSVPAMDIHYGRAGVFCPSDFEFPRDGIQAEADSNVEMLLVTDLDIDDLYRSRLAGSVRPRHDRRSDLFTFQSRFPHADSADDEERVPMRLPKDSDE